jgi:2'-5' RNA ligase
MAAPLPAPAAEALYGGLAALRARHPQARWARLEQLHITLVFLGQTLPSEVGRLQDAMTLTAALYEPFEVSTAAAGGHVDDRRGGVAWLRLAGPPRRVANLSRELDWRIGSNVYAAGRPRPHVTVARRIDDALLADLQAAAPALRTSWLIERVVLYRSHAEAGGSRYEELASRPLTGPAPAA